MIKIDLITGFLGAGKTTFLKKYAAWLMAKGQNICILENDFGAVNVDMMLLKELEGEQCELEMVSGGCDRDCHRRRFRTKLIAMGMSGYDRVLVEPSGIFDVDEFFDALHEEPLDRWYEIGSVIAVVDAKPERELSEREEYLLASEIACAGCVLISRSQEASQEEIWDTAMRLNLALDKAHCNRRVYLGGDLIARDWEDFTEEDFEMLSSCGFIAADYEKMDSAESSAFDSLFFMEARLNREELCRAVEGIFGDEACGRVFRIKGFLRENEADGTGGWIELNATRRETVIRPIAEGQEILIAIGEGLNQAKIEAYLQKR